MRTRALPVFLLSVAALSLFSSRAEAGGFYLADHGTRPLGRGGAMVAGADDPGAALWYNPAGLGFSGHQLEVDAVLVFFDGSFTRVDASGERLPTVTSDGPLFPIPTIAYSNSFGLPDFTFGLGFTAPTSALTTYPTTVERDGEVEPAPQRYSLISTEGTTIGHISAGAAWTPRSIPGLSVGLKLEVVLATFQSNVVLSACDRAICTQPENPEYDSQSQFRAAHIIAPTASVGAIYDLGIVRLGGSISLPYTLSGSGDLRVRLASAAAFDGAYVDGDQAELDLDFPLILRAGVEVRPMRGLRVEAAFSYEGWSTQDAMTITPDGVFIRDVLAIGDYAVGPVVISRNMSDAVGVHLGAEWGFGEGERFTARAGMSYETGTFPNSHLTVLTLDSDKLIASIGGSVELVRGLELDVVYAHSFMSDRKVRSSQVAQPTAIRPQPLDPVYIGNGDYEMEANFVGAGIRWSFDAAAEEELEVVAREAVTSDSVAPEARPSP